MQLISVIIGLAIIYFVQAFCYKKYWNYNLNASAQFTERTITEGQSVTIEEMIENRKWLPLPMVTMKYILSSSFQEINSNKEKVSDYYNRNEVFSILMFQRIRRKVKFVCTKRGVYKIEGLCIQVSDLFFNGINLKDIDSNKKLVVYPGFVKYNQFMEIFQKIYGDIIAKQFMTEDPFIHRGIREYQIYDRMKLINWNSSAKTGELKVNVLENTSEREVVIFLNLQRDTLLLGADISEESIRLTKTFAYELYRQGIKSLIYTNGVDLENGNYIQIEYSDSSKDYMDVVNNSLARIKVREGGNVHTEYESDNFVELYEKKMKKLAENKFLVVISNYQREDFQKNLMDIDKVNGDFMWVVPVSNAKDYHVYNQLKRKSIIWRMNWEGALGGGKFE